jgi:hypothetical protein
MDRRWSGLDHPLARQMVRKRLPRRPLAAKADHVGGFGHLLLDSKFVLAGRALQLLERQLHLVEQPHRAFRAMAVELARQLLDVQSLCALSAWSSDAFALVAASSASSRVASPRSARNAAFSASTSSGNSSTAATHESNHKSPPLTREKCSGLAAAEAGAHRCSAASNTVGAIGFVTSSSMRRSVSATAGSSSTSRIFATVPR